MNPRLPRIPRGHRPPHLVQRRLRALGFSEKNEWMTSNLGKELGFINHEILEPCGEPVTIAGGFDLLGSYNWRRRSQEQPPQIFVPGEAPALVPRRLPFVTSVRAKGRNFRDVNAALMPAFPFEPMFRAVGVMRPGLKFDDVDLVINRNSLHHLLRLANEGRCKDPFRLDLAMVNNTLIATPLWKRVGDPGNYGRVFEQFFTRHSPGLAQSQSHHRAIRYDLGPLKIAVLCEVDAAWSGFPPWWTAQENWTVQTATVEEVEGEEDDDDSEGEEGPAAAAANTLVKDEALKLPTEAAADALVGDAALKLPTEAEMALFAGINDRAMMSSIDRSAKSRVVHLGKGTLSAHTAELATMTKFRNRSKIPQMWLGRTPHLIESVHVANTFTDVRVTHCGAQLLAYEQRHQTVLQKLVTAIKILAHFTSRAPGGHGIAVCTKDSRLLRVFEAADMPESPVPVGIRRRFWNRRGRDHALGWAAVNDPAGSGQGVAAQHGGLEYARE